jgi:hypothetical protein
LSTFPEVFICYIDVRFLTKYAPFKLINDVLFINCFDGVLLRFLEHEKYEKVLIELHYDNVGGHFGGETTTQKLLRARYYWSMLFKGAHAIAHKCTICQKVT